jgi:hypothetical protein
MWAKLEAMAEGARIASQELWARSGSSGAELKASFG